MLKDKTGVKGLEEIGRKYLRRIHRNLPTAMLYQEAVKNREGMIAHLGPLVVHTAHHTELSPRCRYLVQCADMDRDVLWNDSLQGISVDDFSRLFSRMISYMKNKEAYVQTLRAGSGEGREVTLRIITENAWHSLFVRNLYTPLHPPGQGMDFVPDFTIAHAPGFISMSDLDNTKSASFIMLHLGARVMFIGGTSYAGEIRQAVFSIVSTLLFRRGVLSLRCASNVGADGGTALFLGRRGTGKTSLATEPGRKFLGDHGHGWDGDGVFAFEKGCYAKVLGVLADKEPELFQCTRSFGTILENVAMDPDSTRVDLADRSLTENTRAAYPATHLSGHVPEMAAGHPKDVFLLTRDAFGVLPPIARLTPQQAAYAFLSSYTSVFHEDSQGPRDPAPRFSSCFGTCPLALPPHEYAMRFMEKIVRHGTRCWIMNTGWAGEPYGKGDRIDQSLSRTLVRAATSGVLDSVPMEEDPVFGFRIPSQCPGVESRLLDPRQLAADPGEYEIRANRLAQEFMADFSRFGGEMPEDVRSTLSDILSFEDPLDLVDLGFSM